MFAVFKRKKNQDHDYALAIKLSDSKALVLYFHPEDEIEKPFESTFLAGDNAPEDAKAIADAYNAEQGGEEEDEA